jgi:hypothetical protein
MPVKSFRPGPAGHDGIAVPSNTTTGRMRPDFGCPGST